MTADLKPGTTTARVPKDVYDFVEDMRKDDPEAMTSIQAMTRIARERKLPDVANWLKENPIAYGIGYWGEFAPVEDVEGKPAYEAKPETKPRRRRRRRPPNND